MSEQVDKIKVYAKLSSGEVIIGEAIAKQNDVCMTLINVVSVVVGPQGGALIGFMPALPKEATVVINNGHIVAVADLPEDLEVAYTEYTTGLKTPSKKLLVS